MTSLSDKEVGILENISRRASISQRELAKSTGISLGLINFILKKLIKTGYVQFSHINKRKVQYILTAEGLIETAKKTYHHTTDTIRNYQLIQSNLAKLLLDLHRTGYEYFSIHGDGELRELVEITFYRCLEDAPVTLGKGHRIDPRAIVLNLTPELTLQGFQGNIIPVLDKLGI